jgi:hypothetical protein
MSHSEIIIYQNPDGNIKIDVRLEDETVWLTQEQMATLFGKAKSTINEHIKNVFKEGELDQKVVIRKFRRTTQHGLLVEQYLAFAETMAQQRTPMYMNDWIQRLDAILQLYGREILTHAGKISHELALKKSGEEFEKFQLTQKTLEKEQSLNELEADIKKLKPKS